MISSLRGKLLDFDASTAVVECGGVGFLCYITSGVLASMPKINEEIFLYTYMSVKDDAIDLYGFSSQKEREFFKLITSVSGVGPKTGIAVMSSFTPEQLAMYIASEDYKSISVANGVGGKTAQRIVLELKDKIGKMNISNINVVENVAKATAKNSNSREAVEALVSLGFTNAEASTAVSEISPELTTEEIIKESLKKLSRRL